MNQVFYNKIYFNGNISNWNTSSVIDMAGMFWEASKFNGDISNWNTSSVTDMRLMFLYASSFNRTFQWDCALSKSNTYACVCKHAWAGCNCPSGQYRPVADLKGCRPKDICSPGTYMVHNGTNFRNRECTRMTDCMAGSRVTANGTATSDRTCAPCEAGKFSSRTTVRAGRALTVLQART